jgi:hypothetical protein
MTRVACVRGGIRSTHVFCPSPSQVALYNGATNNGPQDWPAHDSHGVSNNGGAPFLGGPDIAQHTTGVGDGG